MDIYAPVWTLVLAFQEGSRRSITALYGASQKAAHPSRSRSSFSDRFTPQLVTLRRTLAQEAMASLGAPGGGPPPILASFKELLALGATGVRLHALLSQAYAACRTNHTRAAAKLYGVMNILDGSPRRGKLTPERVHDQTPWRRVGQWVKGCLLLFDRGSCCAHLFHRIEQNGGFFLTRLKAHVNPLIVAVHRQWRGRRRELVGKPLKEGLPRLKGQVLDVEGAVPFRCRASLGHRSQARRPFKGIAIRNQDTGRDQVSITTLPAERLPAEDVSAVYALRWRVELLFKALKSHGGPEQLPSSNRAVVEAGVWASILATVASQALYRLIRAAIPVDRFVPPLRGAGVFCRTARELLQLLLHPNVSEGHLLLDLLIQEATDPNVNRKKRAINLSRP